MSVYKRGDSFWYEFVVRGVRYRSSIGKITKTVAREVAEKKRIEALEGKLVERPTKAPLFGHYDPATGKFSEGDAAEKYLAFYRANRKPSSTRRMEVLLADLCKEFGNKRLTEIDPHSLEQYKLRLKQQEYAAASINRALAAIKGILTKAVEWRWIRENPARSVKFIKEHNARDRYLTLEEERELLKQCHALGNLRLATLVLAAVDTGFRASELESVCWKDVNFERSEVCVASGYTKNGDPRRNPMTTRLREMLSLLKGAGNVDPQAPVFGPYRYHKSFWKARDAAKLGKDVVFHTLRHTFISRLVTAGVDLRTVQELAGHREIKMTMRYSHLAPESKRQAIGLLEKQVPTNSPTPALGNVVSAWGARSSTVRAGDS